MICGEREKAAEMHTPEPWHVIDNNWETSTIYSPEGTCIAECEISEDATEETQSRLEAIKEANARRIVACVNACAGIPTDVLEDKSILKASAEIMQQRDEYKSRHEIACQTINDLQQHRDCMQRALSKSMEGVVELTAQRDELLAALEGVLPWVVTQTVACNGMKCREPICLSCTDEAEAEENAQTACDMYAAAKKAIASVKGQK